MFHENRKRKSSITKRSLTMHSVKKKMASRSVPNLKLAGSARLALKTSVKISIDLMVSLFSQLSHDGFRFCCLRKTVALETTVPCAKGKAIKYDINSPDVLPFSTVSFFFGLHFSCEKWCLEDIKVERIGSSTEI